MTNAVGNRLERHLVVIALIRPARAAANRCHVAGTVAQGDLDRRTAHAVRLILVDGRGENGSRSLKDAGNLSNRLTAGVDAVVVEIVHHFLCYGAAACAVLHVPERVVTLAERAYVEAFTHNQNHAPRSAQLSIYAIQHGREGMLGLGEVEL